MSSPNLFMILALSVKKFGEYDFYLVKTVLDIRY